MYISSRARLQVPRLLEQEGVPGGGGGGVEGGVVEGGLCARGEASGDEAGGDEAGEFAWVVARWDCGAHVRPHLPQQPFKARHVGLIVEVRRDEYGSRHGRQAG
jgi:hypothetical protein